MTASRRPSSLSGCMLLKIAGTRSCKTCLTVSPLLKLGVLLKTVRLFRLKHVYFSEIRFRIVCYIVSVRSRIQYCTSTFLFTIHFTRPFTFYKWVFNRKFKLLKSQHLGFTSDVYLLHSPSLFTASMHCFNSCYAKVKYA